MQSEGLNTPGRHSKYLNIPGPSFMSQEHFSYFVISPKCAHTRREKQCCPQYCWGGDPWSCAVCPSDLYLLISHWYLMPNDFYNTGTLIAQGFFSLILHHYDMVQANVLVVWVRGFIFLL